MVHTRRKIFFEKKICRMNIFSAEKSFNGFVNFGGPSFAKINLIRNFFFRQNFFPKDS